VDKVKVMVFNFTPEPFQPDAYVILPTFDILLANYRQIKRIPSLKGVSILNTLLEDFPLFVLSIWNTVQL